MMAGYRFNKEEYFKETKAVYSNYPTDVSRMEKEMDLQTLELSVITDQYLQYIHMMESSQLEIMS